MSEHPYRIYIITAAEHIREPPYIRDCPDDAAAMAQARKLMDGQTLEVWDGARQVGRLEPARPAGSPTHHHSA